ncbi:MAG TPA: D-aminoacyl-tRNA deacylase, partial [Acidobacteriota bacterium]|nr:D-aminoacyl-tRNA deacylase [Acidobacteriota bacterium]
MNANKRPVVILCSTQDEASMNIYNNLLPYSHPTQLSFDGHPIYLVAISSERKAYLVCMNRRSITAEHIDQEIVNVLGVSIDAVIFATKHDSKSGVPSFCVHTQGNWATADMGGHIGDVAICPIFLKHLLFSNLLVQNTTQYEVVNECTHHGPSLNTPSVFIEIGSTITEWKQPANGRIVAAAIRGALTQYSEEENDQDLPIVMGIGGTHTCSNYNRLVAEQKIMLSHVCPSYAVDGLTSQMIVTALKNATLPASVIVDWKSLNATQ